MELYTERYTSSKRNNFPIPSLSRHQISQIIQYNSFGGFDVSQVGYAEAASNGKDIKETEVYASLFGIVSFLNHSKDANIKIQELITDDNGIIVVRAIRDIKKGE